MDVCGGIIMIGMWVRLSEQGFKNICVSVWMKRGVCVCVCCGGYSRWIARSISSPSVPVDVCVLFSRLGCRVNGLISGSRVTHGLGHTQTHGSLSLIVCLSLFHTHTHTPDLHTNAPRLRTQQASFIKDSYILMHQSGLCNTFWAADEKLILGPKSAVYTNCPQHSVIFQMQQIFLLMINWVISQSHPRCCKRL